MSAIEYWTECISEAFEEAGISATGVQIQLVAKSVEISHDCFGMAFGHDCIANPLAGENDRLKKELKREQGKTICTECSGKGGSYLQGPYHGSYSACWKCNGTGFIY